MDTRDAWLLLNASGLSGERQRAALRQFASPQAILEASDSDLLNTPGFTAAHLGRMREALRQADLPGLRAACSEHGIDPVGMTEANYPPLLKEIADPPPVLLVQGDLQERDQLAVAIVGTRKATPYGLTIARGLAGDLSRRGFAIVSGLARGIDAAAHLGALEAGGRTIAVMATGPDITYPSGHRQLREKIAGSGAVVTEMPFGMPPMRELFPVRNRIISGLSLGVVVVEAPDQSGALITARLGGEQGREVFAVPGPIDNPCSRGCHALIKDGAGLVEFAEDVVAGLGILLEVVPFRDQRQAPELLGDEKLVYDRLSFQPSELDALAEATGLPSPNVTAALMLLEVKGLARRFAGGLFARVS